MRLRLLAFGIAKDILGQRSSEFVLEEGSTIGELKSAMLSEYRDFGKLASVAFAVNQDYVKESHVLNEGDEIVIIPPVSGG